MNYSKREMASYIDHTLLKPDATKEQILQLCQEAKEHHFASVCVNSCWIDTIVQALKGTDVTPCCVVGFPLGAMLSQAKAFETQAAVEKGAREIDMVICIGHAKDHDWEAVEQDIAAVTRVKGSAKVKVILETCLLTPNEITECCKAAVRAGADFVKTSTGFSSGGARTEDVRLMRQAVGPDIGVKASGKVRTFEDAAAMIEAGANRLGTSSGIDIIKDLP